MTRRSLLLALLLAAPLGLAGCLSSSTSGSTAETGDAASVASVPPDLAVSIDGALGGQFMACPAILCFGRSVLGENDRFFEQPALGDLAAVNLTMEWDASSRLTEVLRVGIYTCVDPCESDADVTDIRYVDGPSPLVLTTDAMTVPSGEGLFIFAWVPSLTPSPTYTVLTTPQGFHIEGTLTPAAASADASPVLNV